MDGKKISFLLSSNKNLLSSIKKRFTNANVLEQNGFEDLQKYIFLKKLKSDTESQILRVSLFLKSLHKNHKLIPNENKEEDLKDIIRILKINPENKERKEILKLINFFASVELNKLFEFPNFSEQVMEKLIVYCCINSKTKMFKRNSIIYNIGDKFDKFYILMSGKVGVYKTIKKSVNMSGFSYFQYIYDLYLKKEQYLLKIILQENYKLFPIDESMMDYLNIKLAKYLINNFQNKKEYINIFDSKEDILKMCYINPSDFPNINENVGPEENIESNSIYRLLSRIKDENNIHIYEYLLIELYTDKQILEKFNNNDIIKNYKLTNTHIHYKYNITPPRQYSLKTLSETYVCYFDLEEYIYYFIEIYRIYMHEQASFLINNFIFNKIVKHFENHYFDFFEYEEIKANEYLFKENGQVEYIYILKKGKVELSINKNIFKIQDLINKLSKNLESSNSSTTKDKRELNFKVKEIELEKVIAGEDENKKWDENKKEMLVVLEQNETIGIECLYLDINYFYDAKIGNKDSRFYKIRKDNLMKIFDIEHYTGINLDYQKEAKRKINFFLLRLINLTKVKINCIKSKKFHNLINDYYQINKGRNYRKVKLDLKYKKANLRLKSLDEPNDISNIIKKNKNSNESLNNAENIFLLTDAENKDINKSSKRPKLRFKTKKNSLIIKRNNTDYNINVNEKENIKNNKRFPRITLNNQVFLSLKKEEILVNKLNQKLSNDNLFFTKINKDNKRFQNLKLIEKIKTLKFNNSYNGNIYDDWKTFHININIDHDSHRKKLNKINWYKNIDIFPFNSEESKEKINNKFSYGIQVDKKRVTFIKDKIFYKNNI